MIVFNAAVNSPTMLQLFPDHTLRHYRYLRDSLPDMVPQLKVCHNYASHFLISCLPFSPHPSVPRILIRGTGLCKIHQHIPCKIPPNRAKFTNISRPTCCRQDYYYTIHEYRVFEWTKSTTGESGNAPERQLSPKFSEEGLPDPGFPGCTRHKSTRQVTSYQDVYFLGRYQANKCRPWRWWSEWRTMWIVSSAIFSTNWTVYSPWTSTWLWTSSSPQFGESSFQRSRVKTDICRCVWFYGDFVLLMAE